MSKTEKLDQLYARKTSSIPDRLTKELGHFNVFRLKKYAGKNAQPVPYRRRDYFKITLVIGTSRVHYADKTLNVDGSALVFSNPQIPYKWESIETITGGYFCIFDDTFFHNFGEIEKYPVFRPEGHHVFDLSKDEMNIVSNIYENMFDELDSDYAYRMDLLRNLVFELIHIAMKRQPSTAFEHGESNASQRITMLFKQLLDRQFPLEDPADKLVLRTASDYANRLNMHVNHLNRALKETTQKTTSELLNERLLKEAKILLKHTNWNVSEIGYALGFNEATHFSNFFKKHSQISPTEFRNA